MVKYNLFFFPSEEQWITKLSEFYSQEGEESIDLGCLGINIKNPAVHLACSLISFCFVITRLPQGRRDTERGNGAICGRNFTARVGPSRLSGFRGCSANTLHHLPG